MAEGLKKTYTDEQISERGREIVMEASDKLLAAVRGGGTAVFSPDRVSALSEAVHAAMAMVEFGPEQEPA